MWCSYVFILHDNCVYSFMIALPVVTIHPNVNGSIIVPEDSNVTLRCEAIGEGTLNYQWIGVSGPSREVYLSNQDTYLTISNITVNDTGEYYCKVDNGGTSVSSMGVQVVVRSKLHKINCIANVYIRTLFIGRPAIYNVSGNQTLNITSNTEKVVLTCEVTGDNTTAYWRRLNGSDLPDHRNQTIFNTTELSFTILRARPHDSGEYQCVAYSPWGVAKSDTVVVSIIAAALRFIQQPTDVDVVALQNVTLNCDVRGFHVRYEWRHYNDSSSNYSIKSNSSTLTLCRVTPLDEGHYYCVAMTGRHNQIFSKNATLTVNGNK